MIRPGPPWKPAIPCEEMSKAMPLTLAHSSDKPEEPAPVLPVSSLAAVVAAERGEAWIEGWNAAMAYVLRGAPYPLRVVQS